MIVIQVVLRRIQSANAAEADFIAFAVLCTLLNNDDPSKLEFNPVTLRSSCEKFGREPHHFETSKLDHKLSKLGRYTLKLYCKCLMPRPQAMRGSQGALLVEDKRHGWAKCAAWGLFHKTTSLVKPVHGLVEINFLRIWTRLAQFY
ncbi:MAG: hypothetical protein GY820_25275 [Gammaproteobacteria bacterium]|nr:hypothetical protein [Gammaproteobacteria bacterium]